METPTSDVPEESADDEDLGEYERGYLAGRQDGWDACVEAVFANVEAEGGRPE